jgi:hypothetical protein
MKMRMRIFFIFVAVVAFVALVNSDTSEEETIESASYYLQRGIDLINNGTLAQFTVDFHHEAFVAVCNHTSSAAAQQKRVQRKGVNDGNAWNLRCPCSPCDELTDVDACRCAEHLICLRGADETEYKTSLNESELLVFVVPVESAHDGTAGIAVALHLLQGDARLKASFRKPVVVQSDDGASYRFDFEAPRGDKTLVFCGVDVPSDARALYIGVEARAMRSDVSGCTFSLRVYSDRMLLPVTEFWQRVGGTLRCDEGSENVTSIELNALAPVADSAWLTTAQLLRDADAALEQTAKRVERRLNFYAQATHIDWRGHAGPRHVALFDADALLPRCRIEFSPHIVVAPSNVVDEQEHEHEHEHERDYGLASGRARLGLRLADESVVEVARTGLLRSDDGNCRHVDMFPNFDSEGEWRDSDRRGIAWEMRETLYAMLDVEMEPDKPGAGNVTEWLLSQVLRRTNRLLAMLSSRGVNQCSRYFWTHIAEPDESRIEHVATTRCFAEPLSGEWLGDACCNDALVDQCCAPRNAVECVATVRANTSALLDQCDNHCVDMLITPVLDEFGSPATCDFAHTTAQVVAAIDEVLVEQRAVDLLLQTPSHNVDDVFASMAERHGGFFYTHCYERVLGRRCDADDDCSTSAAPVCDRRVRRCIRPCESTALDCNPDTERCDVKLGHCVLLTADPLALADSFLSCLENVIKYGVAEPPALGGGGSGGGSAPVTPDVSAEVRVDALKTLSLVAYDRVIDAMRRSGVDDVRSSERVVQPQQIIDEVKQLLMPPGCVGPAGALRDGAFDCAELPYCSTAPMVDYVRAQAEPDDLARWCESPPNRSGGYACVAMRATFHGLSWQEVSQWAGCYARYHTRELCDALPAELGATYDYFGEQCFLSSVPTEAACGQLQIGGAHLLWLPSQLDTEQLCLDSGGVCSMPCAHGTECATEQQCAERGHCEFRPDDVDDDDGASVSALRVRNGGICVLESSMPSSPVNASTAVPLECPWFASEATHFGCVFLAVDSFHGCDRMHFYGAARWLDLSTRASCEALHVCDEGDDRLTRRDERACQQCGGHRRPYMRWVEARWVLHVAGRGGGVDRDDDGTLQWMRREWLMDGHVWAPRRLDYVRAHDLADASYVTGFARAIQSSLVCAFGRHVALYEAVSCGCVAPEYRDVGGALATMHSRSLSCFSESLYTPIFGVMPLCNGMGYGERPWKIDSGDHLRVFVNDSFAIDPSVEDRMCIDLLFGDLVAALQSAEQLETTVASPLYSAFTSDNQYALIRNRNDIIVGQIRGNGVASTPARAWRFSGDIEVCMPTLPSIDVDEQYANMHVCHDTNSGPSDHFTLSDAKMTRAFESMSPVPASAGGDNATTPLAVVYWTCMELHERQLFYPCSVMDGADDATYSDILSTADLVSLIVASALYGLIALGSLFAFGQFMAPRPWLQFNVPRAVTLLLSLFLSLRCVYFVLVLVGALDRGSVGEALLSELPTLLFFSMLTVLLGNWITLVVLMHGQQRWRGRGAAAAAALGAGGSSALLSSSSSSSSSMHAAASSGSASRWASLLRLSSPKRVALLVVCVNATLYASFAAVITVVAVVDAQDDESKSTICEHADEENDAVWFAGLAFRVLLSVLAIAMAGGFALAGWRIHRQLVDTLANRRERRQLWQFYVLMISSLSSLILQCVALIVFFLEQSSISPVVVTVTAVIVELIPSIVLLLLLIVGYRRNAALRHDRRRPAAPNLFTERPSRLSTSDRQIVLLADDRHRSDDAPLLAEARDRDDDDDDDDGYDFDFPNEFASAASGGQQSDLTTDNWSVVSSASITDHDLSD